MTDFRNSALTYLRFVLAETNLSPSALAKKAGVSSTTITRPLNDPEHKYTLTTSTLEKIATATGLNPAPFLDAGSYTERATAWNHPETYAAEHWGPQVTDLVMVAGEVAAGNWKEVDHVDLPEVMPLSVKPAFYATKDCFGLIVRGKSLNKIAKDGDILLCVSVDALKHPVRSGDLVIVERRSDDGGKIEVTAKRLKGGPGRWEFWPESTEPGFQSPIVTGDLGEDDTIRVIAEVDCIIRDTRERGA